MPEKKALALIRMFHGIHLLGDWNTTLTEHLMPPEEIGKSFVKAAKDFFPQKYAAMVERKLSNVRNYASVSKLAQEYSTCLRECRIGDCMKEAGYKIWKWSIDANIKANEKNELRKNRIRETDLGKEPGGGRDSKLAERKSKRPSAKSSQKAFAKRKITPKVRGISPEKFLKGMKFCVVVGVVALLNTYNKNYHRFSGITPKDLMGDFPEGTFDVGISGDEDSIDGDEDISSKGGREE